MADTGHGDELARTYNPAAVESHWYDWWDAQGYFTPRIDPDRRPFVIVMPPPNVTGELHMGHALFVAVEDILTRWHRMKGDPTLWLPGADHAGIAGQWVVEKEIAAEGLSRHDLGRDQFLERVWSWMERYRGRIREQLRILGASCDWSRFTFTMDPAPSRAVRTAFKRLYDQGLIYRGERMINWCPRCMTALSDLEVNYDEVHGHIWLLRYPLADGDGYVEVATTRPETMLGDTAVAVHPGDERYTGVIGKQVRLPIMDRLIPIVDDEAVDPEFGSGAVKVTPAHDPNDFEIGQRHDLPAINILNEDGTLNDNAGPFAGQSIQEARHNVVAELQRLGYLVRVDEHIHSVGQCDRCGTVVEPLISLQWFARMAPLAAPAIQVARDGTVELLPERFTGIYLHWMENVHDWCLSRQLWWGHRIPVWYCGNCGAVMATAEPTLERCDECGSTDVVQDPDVLDTWFSSGLWPFSTLGWPDDTEDLRYFYPGTVMETGYDIIFLWVARMIFLGLEFMGEAPFSTVYFHGTVRDEAGQRMSKTKGNVLDPTKITADYGSDALRFTLITTGAPGADLKLSVQRVEAGRNFVNKIWNASRFVLRALDGGGVPTGRDGSISPPHEHLSLADRWILSQLATVTADVTQLLEAFQLGEAGRRLYEFLWSEYCDWYIEATKVALNGADPAAQAAARHTLAYVLERSLRLLHPLMPFVTEELWQHLPHAGESIMVAPWPETDEAHRDARADREFGFLMDAVRAIRNARAEAGVEPARWISAVILPGTHLETLRDGAGVLRFLARIAEDRLELRANDAGAPEHVVTLVVDDAVIYLPLAGLVDLDAERSRLRADIDAVEAEIARASELLANENFVARAPDHVVARHRERLSAAQERLALLQSRLGELAG
ncbi:MAG TPA: valine--tRNA ligase [Thermomicrobiaceae bacterium]|nr:valine--tRNA ligase [Thermomicrobiaceae bacterium]